MKKQTGYTLIELMVTLAFAGIILATGIPKLNSFMINSRMISNTDELLASLHLARSEAIKRGQRVVICKSNNPNDGARSCVTGPGGWEDGWLVFEDTDGNNEFTSNDELLKVGIGALGKQVSITAGAGSASISDFVSFTSRGIPKTINGASQSGVLRICDERGLKSDADNVVARGVLVGASGRVRYTKDEIKIGSCP